MQGAAPVTFEEVQPQVAVILALSPHPAFPPRALQSLPVLCSIAAEAAAANAPDSLMAMLVAIFRVCAEAGNRFVYPDLCSLTSSLLSILPAPVEELTVHELVPTPELLRCMVAAVTCVVATLTRISASGPAWLRLHTSVLLRLKQGLSPLPQEALTEPFDVAEALGQPDTTGAWTLEALATSSLSECTTDLLTLTTSLHKHLLEVHRKVVLQTVALRHPLASGRQQPPPTAPANTDGDSALLIEAASGLLSSVVVPCLCCHVESLPASEEEAMVEAPGTHPSCHTVGTQPAHPCHWTPERSDVQRRG